MERTEWLEARRKCITGSDIAAICGISPYRNSMDVYCEKLGLVPEQPDNPAMEWGRRLENVVAEKYAEENAVQLLPGEFTVRDKWMGATPDRLVVNPKKGLEVKTAGFRTAKLFGEPGTDAVPDTHALQCAWYMSVMDINDWDLAVLINGSDYRVYHLKRSARLENRLIEIAQNFRERHILTQTPPTIDGSKASETYLRAVFPKQKGADLVPASPEIEDLAKKIIVARQSISRCEEELATFENQLKAAIGEASGFTGNGWKVTWKAGKDVSKVDWKAVAASLDVPKGVLEKYTTVAPASRRFLFTINE